MSTVKLEHICKKYPNGFEAVKDFNLEIGDKEFIIFVGPSGCGKSTTLRMVAGLEDISGGDLYIDGKRMNDVEPKDRDIAMVFQNYALYPHMTVEKNIAFGLKNLGYSKAEIEASFYEYLTAALSQEEAAAFAATLHKLYTVSKTESRAGFPHFRQAAERGTGDEGE